MRPETWSRRANNKSFFRGYDCAHAVGLGSGLIRMRRVNFAT